MTIRALFTIIMLVPGLACGAPPEYQAAIEAWKQSRVRFLTGPDGYVNLAGLYWLRQPVSRFGSDPASDLVFPAPAPADIGEFALTDDRVTLRVATGVDVRHREQPVQEMVLRDDRLGAPDRVTLGSLAWSVINRDGRFAVRLRDYEHPALDDFGGIDYFPIDTDYRVVGRLQPYKEPRVVRVDTVVDGLDYRPTSPGTVTFDVAGKAEKLEAYQLTGGYLFVFGDATTGHETYPAGRFLYTGPADAEGRIILDFNKAENPPCAFNDYATCPVASPGNRLSAAIPAGERYTRGAH